MNNNHISLQTTEHKQKDNDIWHWKSRFWFLTVTKMCMYWTMLVNSFFDCCLALKLPLYHGEKKKLFLIRWWWYPFCTRPTWL